MLRTNKNTNRDNSIETRTWVDNLDNVGSDRNGNSLD